MTTPLRLLLAVLVATIAACGDSSAPAPLGGELLALTYNVAGLPEGLSGSRPSIYTEQIAPKLDAYELVLLQETWQTPENPPFGLRVYHEILVAGASHPYKSEPAPLPLGSDPRRPSALVSDGLNVFSIHPFEPLVREMWSDCDASAADCLSQKGFAVTRTTIAPGVEVDVYDLHMEAGGTRRDEELRDLAVSQLRDFIARYSAGRAVIVGGDFNLHTDEEPDASQYRRLLEETGLVDACEATGCDDFGRIDKFAYRSGGGVSLRALSWRLEDDVFVTAGGAPLSDHEAVAVRFAWLSVPRDLYVELTGLRD